MVVESDPDWRSAAAGVKSRGRISIADAWVASLALMRDAKLVHKDPEFDAVEELKAPALALLACPVTEDALTDSTHLDVLAEIAAIAATLEARRDPSYEWGMRRTVPSALPAHSTRVPEIRRTAAELRKTHRGLRPEALFELCDALWATGWREERIVAVSLIEGSKSLLAAVDWKLVERWSRDLENWEHVDWLAGVTGRLLIVRPSLRSRVEAL